MFCCPTVTSINYNNMTGNFLKLPYYRKNQDVYYNNKNVHNVNGLTCIDGIKWSANRFMLLIEVSQSAGKELIYTQP